jgi:hypothetical protein
LFYRALAAHLPFFLPLLFNHSPLLRFDLEAKLQDVERLKRRVRELETAYKNIVSATGVMATKTGSGVRTAWDEEGASGAGAAGRGKRERDLEGVIEAMKKIIDKVKSENDRLRKGVGTGTSTGGGVSAGVGEGTKAVGDKKKTERLEEELRAAQTKLKSFEESGQKLLLRQQQLTSMRKQLKSKEDELAVVKEAADSMAAEKEVFRRKATAAEGRVQQLEVTVQQARQLAREKPLPQGGQPSREKEEREITELRRRAAEDREDNRLLRAQVEDMKARQKDFEKAAGKGAGGGGGGGSSETNRLKEENEKLRQELAAFDLDFFEEIENLKYAHSEAVKKLRMYEGAGDGPGFGGRGR